MIDFAEVWEGWRNHLFPPEKLKEYIKVTSISKWETIRIDQYIALLKS